MVQEELQSQIDDLVLQSRKAKDWRGHTIAESQASILEEMLELPQVMLREEERVRKENLEEKEE